VDSKVLQKNSRYRPYLSGVLCGVFRKPPQSTKVTIRPSIGSKALTRRSAVRPTRQSKKPAMTNAENASTVIVQRNNRNSPITLPTCTASSAKSTAARGVTGRVDATDACCDSAPGAKK
jgi:hypothetical protein